MMSDDDAELFQWTFQVDPPVVAGGEITPFLTRVGRPPASAFRLEIDFETSDAETAQPVQHAAADHG